VAHNLFTRRIAALAVMLLAAVFEVGGDAMIRAGLRGRGWLLCAIGAGTLAAYGLVVNVLPMDFSKLFGTYVAFFAIVGIAAGRLVFREPIAPSTWVGLGVILMGSAIVQFGAAE
jgi:drug/metabolite transporter superfamily protein YnfA